MVSKSLNNQYLHLNKRSFPRSVINVFKIITANYPILKKALFKWILFIKDQHILITGDIIYFTTNSL